MACVSRRISTKTYSNALFASCTTRHTSIKPAAATSQSALNALFRSNAQTRILRSTWIPTRPRQRARLARRKLLSWSQSPRRAPFVSPKSLASPTNRHRSGAAWSMQAPAHGWPGAAQQCHRHQTCPASALLSAVHHPTSPEGGQSPCQPMHQRSSPLTRCDQTGQRNSATLAPTRHAAQLLQRHCTQLPISWATIKPHLAQTHSLGVDAQKPPAAMVPQVKPVPTLSS